jgi:hypothetical protein
MASQRLADATGTDSSPRSTKPRRQRRASGGTASGGSGPPQQNLECDLPLQPRQRRSEAVVDAAPEREVSIWFPR